ncbi:chromatin accessibility complex protein 1 isoform X2 [Octodon degus]|uniref:Chromatin accessibility complex protein 1 n=1 Tax=Octodon degus TaxID=10160 RepID=A0A6P6F562_OCTDE|nr:chromatin accessibility complex protein 1 isoform X2 [Octodon degus]
MSSPASDVASASSWTAFLCSLRHSTASANRQSAHRRRLEPTLQTPACSFPACSMSRVPVRAICACAARGASWVASSLPDYNSHGAVGRPSAPQQANRSRWCEKMADVAVGKDKCGEQRLVSLPLSRIRVIMKSSPEVSSINQEALVLTAKATELFVQYLATYSYRHGSGKERKALTYSDLANTAEESETFQFLAGI